MKMRRRSLAIWAMLLPVDAIANTAWPIVAMHMQQALFSTLWVVLFGLAVEFFVLWRLLALPPGRAFAADVTMNLASAAGGMLLAGFIAGMFAEGFPYPWNSLGVLVAVIAANFVFLCLLNVLIEGAVLSLAFRLPLGARRWAWLGAANAVTVAASLAALWLHTGGKPWISPKSLV